MKFAIRYEEILADTYFVEARSSKEAINKLHEAISNGDMIPPDRGAGWKAVDLCWDEEDIPEAEI